jgi:hypothetical protein
MSEFKTIERSMELIKSSIHGLRDRNFGLRTELEDLTQISPFEDSPGVTLKMEKLVSEIFANEMTIDHLEKQLNLLSGRYYS